MRSSAKELARRALAVLLSIAMVSGMCPATGLAEEFAEGSADAAATVEPEGEEVAFREEQLQAGDVQDAEAERPSMPAFDQEVELEGQGVAVRVQADEGAFPEGATLRVEAVRPEDEQAVEDAVAREREDGRSVAESLTLDVRVEDADGSELQPAEGKKVDVSFKSALVADKNLATSVYHLTEVEDPKRPEEDRLEAESLELKKGDGEELATVEADGFSYYTVEFTYGDLQYVMEGDSAVPLADILAEVGLTGEATAATTSNPTLFSVEDEDGTLMVTANQAFNTVEWMKVTVKGVEYEIVVTDDAVNSWSTLQAALNNGGSIKLSSDIVAASTDTQLIVSKDTTLDLNGHTIDKKGQEYDVYGRVIAVRSGTLTIKDSAGGGTITGGYFNSNSNFTFDNTDTADGSGNGAGIFVNNKGAELVLESGTITNNKGAYYGGNIAGGVVKILGGTISNGEAGWLGGGIYSRELTTQHCTITNNTSRAGGGIAGSNLAIKQGTVINYNRATHYEGGGGIFPDGLTNIEGADISFNESAANGGGIGTYAYGGPNIYIKDSYIHDNTAENSGGAIGNLIYSNTKGVALEVKHTKIYNNRSGSGGALYGFTGAKLENLQIIIEDCEFFNNESGAILLRTDYEARLKNITTYGNTSGQYGVIALLNKGRQPSNAGMHLGGNINLYENSGPDLYCDSGAENYLNVDSDFKTLNKISVSKGGSTGLFTSEIPTTAGKASDLFYSYYPNLCVTESGTRGSLSNYSGQAVIRYFPNGGAGPGMDDQYADASGKFIAAQNTFTREGYRFMGWATNANGSGESYNPGDEVTVTSVKNLFATWEAVSYIAYSVSVDAGVEHGSVSTDVSASGAEEGAKVSVAPTPEGNYELERLWYVADGSEDEVDIAKDDDGSYSFKMPAASVTVHATFKESQPTSVQVSYYDYTWNGARAVGTENTAECERVTEDTISWGGGSGTTTWYAVTEDVEIDDKVTVSGTVNLVLCDGATLSVSNGIAVNKGNALNVYGQKDNTGKLLVSVLRNNYAAGIGGGEFGNPSGDVMICGGSVRAVGGPNGAGIGGNNSGSLGKVTIRGRADVYARGDNAGAGIGGGSDSKSAGGAVEIVGEATVEARGAFNAAGIGGGGVTGVGAEVHIGEGASVNAYGAYPVSVDPVEYGIGAGIGGGGGYSANSGVKGGSVLIDGRANVRATSGGGAGIGGGRYGSGGDVTIRGDATVVAASNGFSFNGAPEAGAGIGGGAYAVGGTVRIGGTAKVTATGGANGSAVAMGIGAGHWATDNGTLALDAGVTLGGGVDDTYANMHVGGPASNVEQRYQYMVTPHEGPEPAKYQVAVVQGIEHGSVSTDVSASGAEEGAKVSVTPTPEGNYELERLWYVADGSADEVDIAKGDDGSYSFQMPAADVIVHATFKESQPASSVTYREPTWNDQTRKTAYEDKDVPAGYTVVTSGMDVAWGSADGAWYVVSGEDVEISSRIKVTGIANLVLCDGATLTAVRGMEVPEGSTLNVYGQSEGTGKLVANGPYDTSGIGCGSGTCGTINICGGEVVATGNGCGSGIGGGYTGENGTIVIWGSAKVTANGGDWGGSGIGSGRDGIGTWAIKISGDAVVEANGGRAGVGIGSGWNSRDVCSVEISGDAVVAARGGTGVWGAETLAGAGIGGGDLSDVGTITILDSARVTAIGGGPGYSVAFGDADAMGIGTGTRDHGDGPNKLVLGPGVTLGGGTTEECLDMHVDGPVSNVEQRYRYMVTPHEAPAPTPAPDPAPTPTPKATNPTVTYSAHVQKLGNLSAVKNGATAGTTGESRRMEALRATVEGGSIEYRSHLRKTGWEKEWSKDGELSGTTGESRRLEAVQMRLAGGLERDYSVWYRVHSRTFGWLGWARDGEAAGTAGMSKRAEAVQVVVLPKGEAPEGYDASAPAFRAQLKGRAHLRTTGWGAASWAGTLGTTGQSRRLEALQLTVPEGLSDIYGGGVEYQLHLRGTGWQGWKADGEVAGTTGQYRRAEAVRVRLTGELAEHYSVWYRVHSRTFGWSGWAADGDVAGTTGLSKRAEAVQVVVLPKGAAAPGATASAYRHG